ncbi:MAG: alpha/beta fold hydrolase [Syntrophales bacterium]|nr:alpha/beta fold hydrolase [Syntrophales bacterium]
MESLLIGKNPRLEAIREGTAPRCVVIAHPHPLHGGDMYNNVVVAAREAALAQGFSSLRFNFRGVGLSEGSHDQGRGEVQDLEAALAEVGPDPILIAYSFGAWVASTLLAKGLLSGILIAPPTGGLNFPDLKGRDIRVVVGSNDQFCDQKVLKDKVDPVRITIVGGIDHFWFGHEKVLRSYLDGFLIDFKGDQPVGG